MCGFQISPSLGRVISSFAMSKPSFKKPAFLETAFEPDAWERFEYLAKVAAKTGHVPHTETAPKWKRGLGPHP
jgi:hypothetical protein